MITRQLKNIFALSILLFVAHGVEEIMTGFYNLDQWDEWIFGLLPLTSIHQAMFATFQIMFWVLLGVSLLLILSERVRFNILAIVGVIYIFEIHHVIKAVLAGGYYPGLITALVFPFFAYFFWKEWFRARAVSSSGS